jgi:hypothetical protein
MLKLARKHGCPWDGTTTARAAGARHLEVLKWAYAQGSIHSGAGLVRQKTGWEDDKRTCASAAATGQLEVLKWLRASGAGAHKLYFGHGPYQAPYSDQIRWDVRTWQAASGYPEVEDWLAANDCPNDYSSDDNHW